MAGRHAPIRLYLVTDRSQTNGRPLVDVVAAAVRGGVDAVQLREKDLPTRALLELARRLLPVCRQHGARLLINDRIDVALAAGADGVHLPATSFACRDARRLVGRNLLIGVSTHSIADIEAAAEAGADFVVLGPIYATPSKAAFGAPLGAEMLAAASRRAALPVLAIGGIDATNAASIMRSGAAGIAVVRAVCAAADPQQNAINLRATLR
ncbi:MAG TPA: thiamine phosphate synthase [Candidatus Kryptonia bacterium]|nr:thiamine phosphate synthase [Candidatus Kryptonia bacterium]